MTQQNTDNEIYKTYERVLITQFAASFAAVMRDLDWPGALLILAFIDPLRSRTRTTSFGPDTELAYLAGGGKGESVRGHRALTPFFCHHCDCRHQNQLSLSHTHGHL